MTLPHRLAAVALAASLAAAGPAAETKVLLCTGDFGMWSQDRAARIVAAVGEAAPGAVAFDVEQSYDFVRKLEAPGWAERYDAIACGDIGVGQFTTEAQRAIVRFVAAGGGFVYVVEGKSTVPVRSAREALPAPLVDILPYRFPDVAARDDATPLPIGAPLFAGIDFAHSPLAVDEQGAAKAPDAQRPFAIERAHGKGRVIALLGAFSAPYRQTGYAAFEHVHGGWDEWTDLGALWQRVLAHAGEGSPVRAETRADLDAAVRRVPLTATVAIDATEEIDDVRASDLSIVALQQLYCEDGGANEELFLDLNPRGWFDRRTQELLPNTAGTKRDKPALLREYGIRGIAMADDSYGSYAQWDDARFTAEVDRIVGAAKAYPDLLAFFQPGNEPPLDDGYFAFHDRIAKAVGAAVPAMRVIGPNKAFNIEGVDAAGMRAFIDRCGASTDVLNWHIYAQPPANTVQEALYWSRAATGKMRTPGAAKVMFTESDAWCTRESQFDYLMDRAFAFLPEPTIIGCFQYCMEPRSEGGTYRFGVLQPDGEFSANYNAFWAWRDLRGRLVATTVTTEPASAAPHVHVLAATASGGSTVSVVAYYDTGYYDGAAGRRADTAKIRLAVKLPGRSYDLRRSDIAWDTRRSVDVPDAAAAAGTVEAELARSHAVAFTWTFTRH